MKKQPTIGLHPSTGGSKIAGRKPRARKVRVVVGFGFVTALIVLAAMALPAFGGTSTPLSSGEGSIGVTVKAGRLSIKATQVPLASILDAIGTRAGIKIETGNAVIALQEKISLNMVDAPVEAVLKRLFTHRAFVYEFDPEKAVYTLTEAGLFSDGAKGTDGNRTVPGWSGSRPEEIETVTAPGKSRLPEKSGESKVNQSVTPRPAYIPGEILVKFKEKADSQKIADLHAALNSKVLSRVPALHLHRVSLPAGLGEEDALKHYRASGLVDIAGRHALRYLDVTPNDSYYGSQWGHTASGIPDGWQFTTGNSGMVVAVIDSGVRYQHPDLVANIWTNPNEIPGNGIDDDANGYVDDIRGWDFAGSSAANPTDADSNPTDGDPGSHGTHVAGIVGARGNNTAGVAGVAWDIRIMPLKVQADNSNAIASIDVIAAAQYALENGARVVNCSFGGEGYDPNEYLVFTELRNAGILVVCAAGNGDNDNVPLNTDVTPYFPSGYNLDNIISVAAGTQANELASFSNYGAASVDLMAPGVDIWSTVNNNGYDQKSGTSMAAPFVTGTAGLILSRKPTWHYPEVKAALLNTATSLPVLSGKVLTGGKLNAHYALCSSGTVAGDVTCDNVVDAADSTAAMQIVTGAGPEICTTCLSAGIDIDGDLKVGLEEAAYAIRRDSGL